MIDALVKLFREYTPNDVLVFDIGNVLLPVVLVGGILVMIARPIYGWHKRKKYLKRFTAHPR
jgi:hypothetical protein